MSDLDLFAHLEFMNWRDELLEKITLQIESNFPDLLAQIDVKIDQAGTLDLAWSEVQLGNDIAELCSEWAKQQAEEALEQTEEALCEFKARLAPEFSLDPGLSDRLAAMAPVIASAGLAAASIAAVPTVVSLATISTSILAFVGVSYVSWPLFTVGAVALGVTAYTSRRLYGWGIERWRRKLRERSYRRAEKAIFGLGAASDQRTLLDDIQALAVKAATNSMENRI
ncbi:MAG TPA: hypothetical protein DIT67_10680 [Octadecabacter sp.]|nr:hypothetical protein [Octadecabacter sp.]